MAHRISSNGTPYFDKNCILKRPTLVSLLGAITAEWVQVELLLAQLYGVLLANRSTLPKWEKTPHGHILKLPLDEIALQIFEDVQTNALRLRLIKKLGNTQLSKPNSTAMIERLDVVLKVVETAAKARNTFSHALWALSDEYPEALVSFPKSGPVSDALVYGESDFNEALEKVSLAAGAVRALIFELFELFRKEGPLLQDTPGIHT